MQYQRVQQPGAKEVGERPEAGASVGEVLFAGMGEYFEQEAAEARASAERIGARYQEIGGALVVAARPAL